MPFGTLGPGPMGSDLAVRSLAASRGSNACAGRRSDLGMAKNLHITVDSIDDHGGTPDTALKVVAAVPVQIV